MRKQRFAATVAGGILAALAAMTLTACSTSSEGGVNEDYLVIANLEAMSCETATPTTVTDLQATAVYVTEANASETRGILALNEGESNLEPLQAALDTTIERLSSCSDVQPSPTPEALTLEEKASAWVVTLLSNFENPGADADTCANYEPGVDLTEVHYYFDERSKESEGAFGPHFGETPCEVSIQLVERLYRDPMLLADKAVEWGIEGADNSPSGVAQLEKAPFEEREELADAVLGMYAAPGHVLSIEKRDEAYESRSASGDGDTPTTTTSEADKESTVLVTADEESGDKVKEDRLDCGLQDYKPKPPPEPCPPGQVENVNGKCVEPKSSNPRDYRQPGDDGKGPDVGTGPKPPAPETPVETTPKPVETEKPGGGGVVDTPTNPPGSETGGDAPGADPAPTQPSDPPPNEGGDNDGSVGGF